MYFWLAIAPLLVLIIAIVGFKKSVVFSAALALVSVVFTSWLWGTDFVSVLGASLRGFFVATEIILIVFSALIIVEVIRRQDLFEPIKNMIAGISSDYRSQAIIICFALVYFIEGVAGFGTPAIVAVPLLMTLGFKPLHAVVLSLIGDTIPVSFGAIGLPITFGVGSVLEPMTSQSSEITAQVITQVAWLNVLASVLLALLIVVVAVILNNGKAIHIFEYVPFAIVSGLIVAGFALFTALFIGPELPSVVGGMFGIFIVSLLVKRNYLLPPVGADMSLSKSAPLQSPKPLESEEGSLNSAGVLWRALYPYLLLISLLVISRLPHLPIKENLRSIALRSDSLFGSAVQYSYEPFYAATSILFLVAMLSLFFARKYIPSQKELVGYVTKQVRRPYLALILVLVFVQIFIFSGEDSSGATMPAVIAIGVSDMAGNLWPFFAPFVGALGSFLSGSATVSNLIFSGLAYDIAISGNLSTVNLLAVQTVGASVGNMVALHNIVAALAIAGLSEAKTHEVIKANVLPALVLLFFIGAVAMLIAR